MKLVDIEKDFNIKRIWTLGDDEEYVYACHTFKKTKYRKANSIFITLRTYKIPLTGDICVKIYIKEYDGNNEKLLECKEISRYDKHVSSNMTKMEELVLQYCREMARVYFVGKE